jgi:NAD(P)-dependent dehydrogenase (short-subunit alcohol dehydrogenase family)
MTVGPVEEGGMAAGSRFSGKVALVTGAGSGIGRAAALAFAHEGARVIVANRRAESGEETVRRIQAAGGVASFVPVDVTDEECVEAMVASSVDLFGRIDVAVNNAGNEGRSGRLVDQTIDDFAFTMDTNFKSVWLGMKYEVRQMLRQGGGAIVNTASNLAHVGYPNLSLYVAAKSAVVGLTRAVALEYAKEGIRINAVSPGPIETELAARVFGSLDAFRNELAPLQPMGRVGVPDEIAEAILWLACDGSSLVTGQSLLVDGGFTLQ